MIIVAADTCAVYLNDLLSLFAALPVQRLVQIIYDGYQFDRGPAPHHSFQFAAQRQPSFSLLVSPQRLKSKHLITFLCAASVLLVPPVDVVVPGYT